MSLLEFLADTVYSDPQGSVPGTAVYVSDFKDTVHISEERIQLLETLGQGEETLVALL